MAIFDNLGNQIYNENDIYGSSESTNSTNIEVDANDNNYPMIFSRWGGRHQDRLNKFPAGIYTFEITSGQQFNTSYSFKGLDLGTRADGEHNICDITFVFSYNGGEYGDNISYGYTIKSSLYGTKTYSTTTYQPMFTKFTFKIIPMYSIYNDNINIIAYNVIGYWTDNNYLQFRLLSPCTCTIPTPTVSAKTWQETTWTVAGYTERELDNTTDTTTGGGYGLGSMPTDNITIPELPTISISDTGSTLYSLTALQMKNFRSWLWTTDWVENLKKIRTDPMQNIIGISIVDVPITVGLNALIYVGNVASTVEANVISNSFIELDCGEISLDEYYGSFADYEPFIATTLYIPKVGFVQIPADVCVNNTIKVVYHIELSSGEGLCYVQLTSKRDGFTYIWNTYTCHVTSNITLSAQDHSQQLVALGNAIINTGISASNAIVNPASATQGLTNTLSSCIDVATTKNPTSTKGNVGNMSAVMCYKKPYLLINRTNLTKPSSFQENNGYLINYTNTIGGHTGFLQTRNYHCSFNAPYNHRAEIERLMDGGVIINA